MKLIIDLLILDLFPSTIRLYLFYNFLNVEKEIKERMEGRGGNDQEDSKAWKNQAGHSMNEVRGGEEADRSPLIMASHTTQSVCPERSSLLQRW